MTGPNSEAIKMRGKRTQADIARALGISIQTVQRIEYGIKPMPAWYALAVPAAFPPVQLWRVAYVGRGRLTFSPDKYADLENARRDDVHGYPTQADEQTRILFCFPP